VAELIIKQKKKKKGLKLRLAGYQFHCQSNTLDYQFCWLFLSFSNTWSRIAGYIVDYISIFLLK
jgi:hypothetical protein